MCLQTQRHRQGVQTWEPCEAPEAVLKDVHDAEYLNELHTSSRKVASVIELPPLAVLPMWLLQRMLLSNMRRHLSGTMLAAGLAVQHGWSLNLGGGMHHARHDNGVPRARLPPHASRTQAAHKPHASRTQQRLLAVVTAVVLHLRAQPGQHVTGNSGNTTCVHTLSQHLTVLAPQHAAGGQPWP